MQTTLKTPSTDEDVDERDNFPHHDMMIATTEDTTPNHLLQTICSAGTECNHIPGVYNTTESALHPRPWQGSEGGAEKGLGQDGPGSQAT